MPANRSISITRFFILSLLFIGIYSCSKDNPEELIPETDMTAEEEAIDNNDSNGNTNDTTNDDSDTTNNNDNSTGNNDNDTASSSCTNPSDFIFNEENGLVLVEFENVAFSDNWSLKNNGNSFSGEGYLVWEGAQYLNAPGNGLLTYKIKINNPGTYRFHWFNAIMAGNNGTEHNDSWLRFNDADDFYGQKSTSVVYPNGTGQSPNPAGSSSDGWFKIYRSGGNLDFIWSTRTSDHNAHEIFVKFDNPGIYTMEVSARSSNHAIDKFVLFDASWSEADATASTTKSTILCD